MAPRYRVTLTQEERQEPEAISTKGERAARTIIHARALLLLDAGDHGPKWRVAQVVEALGTTPRSLEHLKKRFVEEGFIQEMLEERYPDAEKVVLAMDNLNTHDTASLYTAPPRKKLDWQFAPRMHGSSGNDYTRNFRLYVVLDLPRNHQSLITNY